MPLLAETLIAIALAYLVGVGLGWLLFGRPKKTSFLGDG
jgi:UDP-N-acetylmuramyl pentapeptide phosphotransferase/UDP-N-acetylglucosamine-1-phosphate transferase